VLFRTKSLRSFSVSSLASDAVSIRHSNTLRYFRANGFLEMEHCHSPLDANHEDTGVLAKNKAVED
jgi:hypothetical protein